MIGIVSHVGDMKAQIAEQIHVRRGAETHALGSRWTVDEVPLARHDAFLDPDLRTSEQTPVTPQRWRCDLQEVLPMNAMVYSDIGGHMLFNIHHLRIGREQEFLINLGFASMGHGTVAPIGGKMANPDRPVFAIVGDACFTMNGMELLVAAEYDVPVIWIVENNNMHGVTWHGSKKVSGGRPMKSIAYRKKLHVAEIGAAMGLDAYVVDGPGQIQAVVRKALAANRPTVIEVLVDPTIAPPLQDRAEVIGGFGRE